MSYKSTNELEIGTILAEDVCNLDGQVLFRKGLEVAARHIEILQMWGIPGVEIEGGVDETIDLPIESFSNLIVEKAEALVNARLKLVKSSHPAVDIVRRIAVLEAAKEIQKAHANS